MESDRIMACFRLPRSFVPGAVVSGTSVNWAVLLPAFAQCLELPFVSHRYCLRCVMLRVQATAFCRVCLRFRTCTEHSRPMCAKGCVFARVRERVNSEACATVVCVIVC